MTPAAEPGTRVGVKQFGAEGDGVTDDTTAIHAAIDAAKVGSILYFPCGTYAAYLKGDEVKVGLAIVDTKGTPRYGKMTGNAGKQELSLGDTIRLTKYDGKPADVQLDEGATYVLVPVATAGGESKKVRRFHFSIQPMNTYNN